MLVIADAERPVALAGIMGGEDSEISANTKDVLIESAYFNPDSVRRTARLLGMDTEASRRFERGADCENVLARARAMRRAHLRDCRRRRQRKRDRHLSQSACGARSGIPSAVGCRSLLRFELNYPR